MPDALGRRRQGREMRAPVAPALAGLCLLALAASLSLGSANAAASDGAPIDISFAFSPAKRLYAPGENFTIEFTAVNTMPSADYIYDSLAYKEKVTNVSVHFAWMAPGEWAWKDVSSSSAWLDPDGLGSGVYSLPVTVPSGVAEQTYTYYFRVEYMSHTAWGNITYTWGTGNTYSDFVVGSSAGGAADYGPLIAAIALVLSVGAMGAVLYYRREGTGTSPEKTKAVSQAAPATKNRAGEAYPIIHPLPGEHFPIEKGFIYLVKEKRPNVAFAMFNEAVSHSARGMLVAREHPNRLRQVHNFKAEKILWLTRRVGEDHIDPTELSRLNLWITRFVEGSAKSVVLIEGLEYLITQNDFETVLRFVNHLHDFVVAHDCAVIVIVDPRVLSTRELALLERTAKIVEPVEQPEAAQDRASEELPA